MPYIILKTKKIAHVTNWPTYIKYLIQSPAYEYTMFRQIASGLKSIFEEKYEKKNGKPSPNDLFHLSIRAYFKFPLAKGARINECYLFSLLLGNDNLEYFENIIKHRMYKKNRARTIARIISLCVAIKQKNMLQTFLLYQTKLSPHEKYLDCLDFSSIDTMRIFCVRKFLVSKKFTEPYNSILKSRSDIIMPVDRSLPLIEMLKWIPTSYKFPNHLTIIGRNDNIEELIILMKKTYGCTVYKPTVELWRGLLIQNIDWRYDSIMFDILAELSLGYNKAYYSRIKLNPFEVMIDRPNV